MLTAYRTIHISVLPIFSIEDCGLHLYLLLQVGLYRGFPHGGLGQHLYPLQPQPALSGPLGGPGLPHLLLGAWDQHLHPQGHGQL